jgi:hypothetical protein
MTILNEPTAKKITRLFRMLSSPYDGEAHNALTKLKRLLETERLTFNDIAVLIENHGGEIEEKKYSDADADIIFLRGVEKGRAEEQRKQAAPPEFYDVDGGPLWIEIAQFCQQNIGRLHDNWERTFINDMAGKVLLREPSEKQAKHLLAIFVKLGGPYARQAAHLYR